MNSLDLLGMTATAYLSRRIGADDLGEGTARFLLDRLPAAHVASISRRILLSADLASKIRLRIPRALGSGYDLPEDILTDERTTHWRHSACDRPVLLIANTDDDQGQSLRDITPIGSQELLGEVELWVAQASEGLGLSDANRRIWPKALKGLQDARPVSLDNFARFVLATRSAIDENGLPLLHALGWALPELRVPRDSAFFTAIPEKSRGQAYQWKRLFLQAFNKRAPFLLKQTPTQQVITSDQLGEMWDRVRDEIPAQHHPVVQAFIDAPGNWNDCAEALAPLEWEQDNIKTLFDGLRVRRVPLGSQTLEFFEDEYPDTLTEDEQEHLNRLDERKTREANEEDEQFYERHRLELGRNRTLKSRWDRFIFGQPIEANDFAVGMLKCLERLFEQSGSGTGERKLRIEVQKRSKRDWLDMNYDAVYYFSRRYRGLRNLLTGKWFDWEVGDLFAFERLVEREQTRGRFQRTQSTAKATNQIRFDVTLTCDHEGAGETYATQLIWHFEPGGICAEFVEDLARIRERPFLLSSVTRESVSRKGQLQAIDLKDVSTLMPVFRQDRGSLVPSYKAERDVAAIIPRELNLALSRRRITSEGHAALKEAWQAFFDSYRRALQECFDEGVSSIGCLDLESTYGSLLETIQRQAPGDANRKSIWEPILGIGLVPVDGGTPAAIIAPWHPLRLLGMAVKARQLCGLIRYLMRTDSVDFGDPRVFFEDLAEELEHPYYPEVCLGMEGSQPILLCRSDTYADYTLMEPATADTAADDSTNENPTETARELHGLVEEYLNLQPHERANLSVVLYNCNSARLPQALVNVLGELSEDDEEVQCQIVLRHHNPLRLHELYEKILEGSDGDADSFVASEASRDFMAKLRIGIMADSAPIPSPQEGLPTDMVFLQDVIARLAEQVWLTEPPGVPAAELLHHVPPRWSRRRPMTRDDTRSVAYLACPVQPLVGWRYLQALHGVIRSTDFDSGLKPVPARQISFQNNITREIFEEVHRLGQWVVHSDDLLTRRQLRNQGVQVIRHRQQRHNERNITISSKAPLNLLEVMVIRRLRNLSLGLDESELRELASRMMDDANDLSGDIVLRAAKRGQFANELMGLVLSRFLLQDECGAAHCGWYFLDDYANWLGQREEHIADILALSPRTQSDQVTLIALLSESKYVGSDALAKARRTSAVQLRETAVRIHSALFGDPGRLDRDLWLARLGDMILDGIEVAATEGELLTQWRHAIRKGTARILLRGYSHVFVHTQQPDEADPSERNPVVNSPNTWQEIYGRARVRDLVLAYHRAESPRRTRQLLDDSKPWEQGSHTLPTRPVIWTAVPRAGATERKQDPSEEGGGSDASTSPIPPGGLPPAEAAGIASDAQPPALTTVITGSGNQQTPEGGVCNELPVFDWAGEKLRRILSDLAGRAVPPAEDAEWLDRTVQKLRSALLSYDLQARVVGQRLTPNAALVRLQGSDRLRTSDVEHRRDELLTTHGLQITNVLAEPGQVVVAVARPQRQLVDLASVWQSRQVDQEPGRANRRLVLGVRESDGEILYLRPGEEHAPHTLIAGTTGSGKSVLLQNLLLDIAATNAPSAARIILIDPKQGADFLELQDLPHLQGGIIVTQDTAKSALELAVAEMDRRYALFRSAGVANLSRFNARVPAGQREPVLWIVHDEFAVWMLIDEYKEMISQTVQRLGVMARAAGIFLVFAAQRPEDRVMPVQLRDNLGNRLVLRVESTGTSKIALGEEGAERLLGKGHMAARLPDSNSIIFAQVPYLNPNDLRLIVLAIREDSQPDARRASDPLIEKTSDNTNNIEIVTAESPDSVTDVSNDNTNPATARRPDNDEKHVQNERLAEFFRQAADSTRLSIILLLEQGARNVGELCAQLNQSQPAVSHHLAKMRSFGLVESNRSGKNVVYNSTESGSRLARLISDQDTSTSSRAVGLFRQVADSTRLRILLLLGEGEHNVGELCDHVKQSQPAVSHHLAKMRDFGIVAARRSGKFTYYSITGLGTDLVQMILSLSK